MKLNHNIIGVLIFLLLLIALISAVLIYSGKIAEDIKADFFQSDYIYAKERIIDLGKDLKKRISKVSDKKHLNNTIRQYELTIYEDKYNRRMENNRFIIVTDKTLNDIYSSYYVDNFFLTSSKFNELRKKSGGPDKIFKSKINNVEYYVNVNQVKLFKTSYYSIIFIKENDILKPKKNKLHLLYLIIGIIFLVYIIFDIIVSYNIAKYIGNKRK